MANINVKIRLDNIEQELEAVEKHVRMYSGIPKEHAAHIGRVAERVAKMAVAIENEAEKTLMGGRAKGRG
jgi:hypothetical protein